MPRPKQTKPNSHTGQKELLAPFYEASRLMLKALLESLNDYSSYTEFKYLHDLLSLSLDIHESYKTHNQTALLSLIPELAALGKKLEQTNSS